MQFSNKNKEVIHAVARMNLKNIMLSERRQSLKTTSCVTLYEMFRKGKSIDTESRVAVARG